MVIGLIPEKERASIDGILKGSFTFKANVEKKVFVVAGQLSTLINSSIHDWFSGSERKRGERDCQTLRGFILNMFGRPQHKYLYLAFSASLTYAFADLW